MLLRFARYPAPTVMAGSRSHAIHLPPRSAISVLAHVSVELLAAGLGLAQAGRFLPATGCSGSHMCTHSPTHQRAKRPSRRQRGHAASSASRHVPPLSPDRSTRGHCTANGPLCWGFVGRRLWGGGLWQWLLQSWPLRHLSTSPTTQVQVQPWRLVQRAAISDPSSVALHLRHDPPTPMRVAAPSARAWKP